ncbi:MAG: hypothetical protein HYY60_03125 [Parcubacteria group bacterium]|nr:hypothetical protein [Parcubacteria group bacterium]
MNFWLTCDAWLIGKFEKFAHWFQRWTGKTNYFLCGFGAWLLIIVEVIGSTARFLREEVILLPSVLIIFAALIFLRVLPTLECRAFERLKESKTANSGKITHRFPRFLLTMLLVETAVTTSFAFLASSIPQEARTDWLVVAADVLLFFLLAYLSACDPLPPCRGRVWDEIGAFFAKPIMVRKDS